MRNDEKLRKLLNDSLRVYFERQRNNYVVCDECRENIITSDMYFRNIVAARTCYILNQIDDAEFVDAQVVADATIATYEKFDPSFRFLDHTILQAAGCYVNECLDDCIQKNDELVFEHEESEEDYEYEDDENIELFEGILNDLSKLAVRLRD